MRGYKYRQEITHVGYGTGVKGGEKQTKKQKKKVCRSKRPKKKLRWMQACGSPEEKNDSRPRKRKKKRKKQHHGTEAKATGR